jgi:hypothetical protein
MSENTNNQPTLATTEELLAEVTRLTEALACSKNREEFLGSAVTKWASEWQKAKTLLEASFEEDGVDTDNLGYSAGRLVELFEIEFTEEVEVTFTMKWASTITIKKGADLNDLEVESSLPYELAVTLDGETHHLGTDYEEFDY